MTKQKPQKTSEVLGQRLRLARKALGLTQKDLAIKLGITFQQLQKYEKGTNRISVDRLYEVVDILGIDMKDLIGENVKQEKEKNESDPESDIIANIIKNNNNKDDIHYIMQIAKYLSKIDNKQTKDMILEFVKVAGKQQ
jgi:transcriptional regulator with XRE-family HTH domain